MMETGNRQNTSCTDAQQILDQLPDGVFVTDRAHTIIYWNPGARAILGFSPQELDGQSCRALGPLCKRDSTGNALCAGGLCPLSFALSGGFSGLYPHYVFMRTRDGREVPVKLSVSPFKDAEGSITGAIAVFRDMSEEYAQLKLAGEIQKHMVTMRGFNSGPFRVETLFHPLEITGGDYIEVFETDTGLLIATSADATGHGISAALFAMIYKTLFHASLKETYSPAQMLELINRDFCNTATVEGYYLTASIVIFDPSSGKGYFASAGHPTALVLRSRQGVLVPQPINERSFMIGMVDGAHFKEIPLNLGPGDLLFLTSDGIYEAEGHDDIPFGIEGAASFFADGGRDLEDLYRQIKARNPFGELADDVSAILIECDQLGDLSVGNTENTP